MKYMILERFTSIGLTEAVEEATKGGWKPLGGVSIAAIPRSFSMDCKYAQAMTFEPKELKGR